MKVTILYDEGTCQILVVECGECRGSGQKRNYSGHGEMFTGCRVCRGRGHIPGHKLEGATVIPKKADNGPSDW